MLYLDKKLVDMNRISDVNYQDHEWGDTNTPEKATQEKGKIDVKLVIDHLRQEIGKSFTV